MMYISDEIQTMLERIEELKDEINSKCEKIPGNTAKQTLWSDVYGQLLNAQDELGFAQEAANKVEE